VIGLVIGALAIGWALVGGSAAPLSSATSTPTQSASPGPFAAATRSPETASASSPMPTLAIEATPVPQITPLPTLEPTVPETPTPTPPPTLSPTPAPTGAVEPSATPQLGLTFDFPVDGDVLSDQDINIIGTAPPGSTITHDVPMWFDDHTVTRADGIWMLPMHLGDGTNLLRFRIGDDRSTEQVITVYYRP
jgi:hypothetical protein